MQNPLISILNLLNCRLYTELGDFKHKIKTNVNIEFFKRQNVILKLN